MTKPEQTTAGPGKAKTEVQRTSDLELVVTRLFNAPVQTVFRAWSTPDLFTRWWVPKSTGLTLISYDMDVRTGGSYSLQFGHRNFDTPMTFFGTYLEVTPSSRMVWTNEENGGTAVTTVTFEDVDGKTRVVLHDCYPTKEALDIMDEGPIEQFEQLDDLLVVLGV
jgi:uncharacterized protein YndB with AHSA1/START domain